VFEDIVYPYPINMFFLFCYVKGAESLNRIVLKASTKLIPIGHIKGAKSIFFILVKLTLIVPPVGLS
jgi:hypothetical protein